VSDMSDKDLYQDLLNAREKAEEDIYFQSHDQELIAQIRRRIAHAEERRKLADAAHTDDSEIIDVLDQLGYTAETLPVLFLMPIIAKLWESGEIDARKRKAIEDLADSHGMPRGSEAFNRLGSLLTEKPRKELLEVNLLAAKALMVSLPENERKSAEDDILSLSKTLAKAGRGLFGLEQIPKLAQASIEQFFEDIGLKTDDKL